MTTDTLAKLAEFHLYFKNRSAHTRVSVSIDEWLPLYAALVDALTAQAPAAAEPLGILIERYADASVRQVLDGIAQPYRKDELRNAKQRAREQVYQAIESLIASQAAKQAAQEPVGLDTASLRPMVVRLASQIDPEASLEIWPEALAFQINMARSVLLAARPQPSVSESAT
jgi:hypothetical protein